MMPMSNACLSSSVKGSAKPDSSVKRTVDSWRRDAAAFHDSTTAWLRTRLTDKTRHAESPK